MRTLFALFVLSIFDVCGQTSIQHGNGAPSSSDCNETREYGRMYMNTGANPQVTYTCGLAGWVAIPATAGTVTSIATSNGVTGGPITTTGTISGINAAADGTTLGVAAFTAADFNAATGVISLDYANGQKASGSQPGFLSSSDWTTFNNKGSGSVTSITTTSPITGGTITTTGSIACATCVTSAASLTSNQLVFGAGSQAAAVGNLTGDVTTSGGKTTTLVNIPTATTMAGSLLATAITVPGTPAAGNGSIYVDSASKNIAVKDDAGVVKHGVQTDTGTANNYISAISDAGAITKSRPACATLSDSAGGCSMSTTAGGDLSGTLPSPTVAKINGTSFSGTNGHLVSFGASNVPADSGVIAANAVVASSPGVGLAHFAGSTQTVTSSLVVAADITSATITGTQIASSVALAGSPTTTTQSAGDNSTKIATTAYVDSSAITHTIFHGTKALATGAISSAACTSAQTVSATGTLTTDIVTASFNGDPTAVTGYVPLTAGMLTIIVYPTVDTVNIKVCNNTTSSITPGAITLNVAVNR